jgi:chromosome segregation ATPase
MTKKLPTETLNFLAFAELIANPAKVKEVAAQINEAAAVLKEQNDRAVSIADEVTKNQQTLDLIAADCVKLDELKLEVTKEQAKLASDLNEFSKQKAGLQEKVAELDQRESALDVRESAIVEKEDELSRREETIATREVELNNALKLAEDEYGEWKRKNDELARIVQK